MLPVSNLSWSINSNDDDEEYTFSYVEISLNINISASHRTSIENTQASTEKVTDIHYYDGHLWFSELEGFSIKKINLENDEITVFATDNDYLKKVVDITIDPSTGNVYTLSRPSGGYSASLEFANGLQTELSLVVTLVQIQDIVYLLSIIQVPFLYN